ncbi:hypothetical protein VNO80_21172 [Phaseolus coccineus]|uniref:Aminoacyl-tRNA synthetase class II (D/K/N) domain-containing protein n=1 Tax=Phaseolus coccineus TaxID=3886 RepID=A0AAN9M2R0_PHACN
MTHDHHFAARTRPPLCCTHTTTTLLCCRPPLYAHMVVLLLRYTARTFYLLYQFPLAVKPFFTMPCIDNLAYSYLFDLFIRGEEIISGGQRISDSELLEECATACGIDVKNISTFIDAFKYFSPPFTLYCKKLI